MYVENQTVRRKAELFLLIEQLCEKLEPTDSQMERAKTSYEAAGRWLADANDQWLRRSSIYLQGSTAIGTTIKPIGQNEHDVDLVCHLAGLGQWAQPAACKHLVGQRLKEHAVYASLLEEKPRCWRLNYAGDFHLDITPSIVNPACGLGGEFVPDKHLASWKETNPKGYRDAFKRRSELVPRMRLLKSFTERHAADASIEAFPERPRFRGVLCRIVQIIKRHRDVYFAERNPSLAPISVIVTTLAAWSYEDCVRRFEFDSELDVLCTVVENMPRFIQEQLIGGRIHWLIPNETTIGENFAERWNTEQRLETAFRAWHAAAMQDLRNLMEARGLDNLSQMLSKSFGQTPSAEVVEGLIASVSTARAAGGLYLARGVGLTTTAPTSQATPVRRNTFYGAL